MHSEPKLPTPINDAMISDAFVLIAALVGLWLTITGAGVAVFATTVWVLNQTALG